MFFENNTQMKTSFKSYSYVNFIGVFSKSVMKTRELTWIS